MLTVFLGVRFFGGVRVYAIIRVGGKQYRVQAGDVIKVHRLAAEENSEVSFDEVLAINNEGELRVGTPTIEGARAVAQVLKHDRDAKIRVFKYKPKTNYRRRQGHRQDYTQVRIERIEA